MNNDLKRRQALDRFRKEFGVGGTNVLELYIPARMQVEMIEYLLDHKKPNALLEFILVNTSALNIVDTAIFVKNIVPDDRKGKNYSKWLKEGEKDVRRNTKD